MSKLIPQLRKSQPTRLAPDPHTEKGGREVQKARRALKRVASEMHTLRLRYSSDKTNDNDFADEKYAEATPLMGVFFDKALSLIDLIGPSADVEDKENIEAVELAAHAVHAAGRALRGGGDSSSAITTTAVASLAASRGASVPQLLDDYHHNVGVVLAWRLGKARYEEHVLKHGRMIIDHGRWRYVSAEEIQAERERCAKYREEVASGVRTVRKGDEDEHVESLLSVRRKQEKRADSRRGVFAARVAESHDPTVDVPPGIRRTTKGRFSIIGTLAAAALAIDSSFDNTPSTDLASVVERLEQARALTGVKERLPPTLPEGVRKEPHGDHAGSFCTHFLFGSSREDVSLRSFGRTIFYETAEEAAAALARFRAAPDQAKTAMISSALKCCKCGLGFRGRGKGSHARKQAMKRVEAHEETCTVCPAPTL
jgi:hypothetical protein